MHFKYRNQKEEYTLHKDCTYYNIYICGRSSTTKICLVCLSGEAREKKPRSCEWSLLVVGSCDCFFPIKEPIKVFFNPPTEAERPLLAEHWTCNGGRTVFKLLTCVAIISKCVCLCVRQGSISDFLNWLNWLNWQTESLLLPLLI